MFVAMLKQRNFRVVSELYPSSKYRMIDEATITSMEGSRSSHTWDDTYHTPCGLWTAPLHCGFSDGTEKVIRLSEQSCDQAECTERVQRRAVGWN